MKVNIRILRIIIACAFPVPVSNRALKLKIFKRLREEGSIFRESFFQSQNVTVIKKSHFSLSFKFGKCGKIGSFKNFEPQNAYFLLNLNPKKNPNFVPFILIPE